jgi:hypothetical protein
MDLSSLKSPQLRPSFQIWFYCCRLEVSLTRPDIAGPYAKEPDRTLGSRTGKYGRRWGAAQDALTGPIRTLDISRCTQRMAKNFLIVRFSHFLP